MHRYFVMLREAHMSKTNRSNDIRPHKSLLIALTLAATGFVANNAFAQDADAIRQQADAKVASIEAAIEDGQEMLARARENSNVSQIDCINTQLVIARGFLNVAQNANINLKEAITRNDAEATTHHQKLLDLAVEKTEGAAARMKQCGMGVLSVTGETQSTTKRDCKVEPCLGGEEVYAPDAIEKQSLTGADKIDASNNVDASPYM